MPTIVTYRPGLAVNAHTFYLLSKGNNAGKPLHQPCPNCFACICESEEEAKFYYWLAYGMWQAREFEVYITGSVIPFITVRELRKALLAAGEQVAPDQWQKVVKVLHAAAAAEVQYKLQVAKLQELKRVITAKFLRKG